MDRSNLSTVHLNNFMIEMFLKKVQIRHITERKIKLMTDARLQKKNSHADN